VFCASALEMPLHEKPHREMVEYVSDLYAPNQMMLVPRDCWKTSIVSTALPLWLTLRAWFIDGNPAYRCLIDSSTVRLSKFVVDLIRQNVRNKQAFIDIFGDLYDRKGDRQEGLSLSFRVNAAVGIKEPNFVPSGVNAAKTGLHFELIVLDDLVTKENVRTLEQREKVWEHYRMMQGIIESDPTGQKTKMVIVGTRYHDDDIYGRMLKQDKLAVAEGKEAVYGPMIRKAINADGELYFPAKLGKDELDRRRRIMKGLFWAQMMNDPNSEEAPFKPAQLKWHSLTEFPELSRIRMTVDPAFKDDETRHGDFCAMVVAGWDKWNQLWICDASMKDTLTPGSFIDEFFRMAQRWQVESVIMEDDHMVAMELLLRREMQRRNYSVRIDWIKANRQVGKQARWLELQPYAERGGIRIADEIPAEAKAELEDEWCRAPFATYDDFMDALSLQTLYLPLGFEEGAGRMVPGSVRSVQELVVASVATNPGPYWGTLAERFPNIRILAMAKDEEEMPFGVPEDDLSAAMETAVVQ
jgi:hypothetical protein